MQNAYKNLQAIKKWNDMKTWVLYIFLNILILTIIELSINFSIDSKIVR